MEICAALQANQGGANVTTWQRNSNIRPGYNQKEIWRQMRDLVHAIEDDIQSYTNIDDEWMHSIISADEYERRNRDVISEIKKCCALYSLSVIDGVVWGDDD